MFRDGLYYSAVLFQHKDINSSRDFYKLFNDGSISEAEAISSSTDKGISISHFYYDTEKKFTKRSDLDEALQEDGKYRYNFYLFVFELKGEKFIALSFPWLEMGITLLNYLAPSSLSSESITIYYKPDLLGLIDSLKRDRDDHITLLSSKITIEGESNVDLLSITGSNPIYSELFDSIYKLVKLKPNNCKIIHEEDETRNFRVVFDNLGNFVFRVGKDKSNLSKVKSIFSALLDRNLLHPIEGYYNPVKLRLKTPEENESDDK